METEMGVAEALRQRRAIRGFDSAHRMSDEEFNHLMEHVRLSPTANNIQNWRFVRVTDAAQRQAIRQVGWNQVQMTDASELVVFCFNEKAWCEAPERYWQDVPSEVAQMVLGNFEPYFSQPGIERDDGLRSCSMAAMSTMLLAKEMGYDSCPMTGFDFSAVSRILQLPADHGIAMMVAIGKRIQEAGPRPGQLPLHEVVFENRFS
jgi:nitroreductase